MQNFYRLPKETKARIFEQASARSGLPVFAIEKDWWVVQTLRVIFEMDVAEYLLFKGGTSLSKAWKLIDRFSEDIDLALDKAVLGIDQVRTKKQVKTLRGKSKKYICGEFYPSLQKAFARAGLSDAKISLAKETENDPITIEINYPYITKHSGYINPRVLIEIGSRSLKEPFTERTITSFVTEQFPGQEFADKPIHVATVNPERTFLEKIFLLHEEFQKPVELIRTERLSRHLYDIEKMMDTPFSQAALNDYELYRSIVLHRGLMFSIQNVNYNLHQPQTINPIPPDNLRDEWEKDYIKLSEILIYGEKLTWHKLLNRITELKERINKLDFTVELNT
jgi:predicted nucleotidyltransferase component of viral defense system